MALSCAISLLFTILGCTNSFYLPIEKISTIDDNNFDAVFLTGIDSNDENLENTKKLALEHFIVSKEPKNCESGNILKIDNLESLKAYSKPNEYFKSFQAICYLDKMESKFKEDLKQWKKEKKKNVQ